MNCSSVTRGNNYKLLNEAFTTTYGIYTEDTPRLYMRDPACKRGPASIGTSESDPRPVCGARNFLSQNSCGLINIHVPIPYIPILIDPTPHPSANAERLIFFNLSISCRLHKGFQDPFSFMVTTGLLGRLGLGLRVRASIRFIFTSFPEFIINLL